MPEKQNAHPTAATVEQAGTEKIAFGKATSSYFDFTTKGGTRQARISDFLGQGKESAIPGHKLMEVLGAADLRSVSKMIESARRSGMPICASTSPDCPGYYIPGTTDELNGYLRSFDRRLKEMRVTRASLEAVRRSMEGQTLIGGWTDGD